MHLRLVCASKSLCFIHVAALFLIASFTLLKTVNWHKFQTYKLANNILRKDNGRIREKVSCSKYNFTFWYVIYFLDCGQAITIGKYFKREKWSGCYEFHNLEFLPLCFTKYNKILIFLHLKPSDWFCCCFKQNWVSGSLWCCHWA